MPRRPAAPRSGGIRAHPRSPVCPHLFLKRSTTCLTTIRGKLETLFSHLKMTVNADGLTVGGGGAPQGPCAGSELDGSDPARHSSRPLSARFPPGGSHPGPHRGCGDAHGVDVPARRGGSAPCHRGLTKASSILRSDHEDARGQPSAAAAGWALGCGPEWPPWPECHLQPISSSQLRCGRHQTETPLQLLQ